LQDNDRDAKCLSGEDLETSAGHTAFDQWNAAILCDSTPDDMPVANRANVNDINYSEHHPLLEFPTVGSG
jgi:hypothetical protein